MLLFLILFELLIAISLSNNEEKDGQEYLFRLRDIDFKEDVGEYSDGDHEIHAGDLQRGGRVQRYAKETLIGIKHGRNTSYRSKRMRGVDDYEDRSVSEYHRGRGKPNYDDEGADVNIRDDCERRRPNKNRRRPSNKKRRGMKAYFDEECLKCGMMIGGKRLEAETLNDFIIDGTVVEPMYKFPWIVTISMPGWGPTCGGAIISATFVLTASHCLLHRTRRSNPDCKKSGPMPEFCFYKPEEIIVGLLPEKQQQNRREVKIAEVIRSSTFTTTKYIDDIGLIRLEAPLKCDKLASPICLPRTDLNNMNGTLIIAGYGYDTGTGHSGPRMLREGIMQQIPAKVCKPFNSDIKDIVCAIGTEANQSSCKGDSGTSIFGQFGTRVYSLGVTSLHSDYRCQPSRPVTYAKVFRYLDWIKRHVKDLPQIEDKKN